MKKIIMELMGVMDIMEVMGLMEVMVGMVTAGVIIMMIILVKMEMRENMVKDRIMFNYVFLV